MKNIAVQLFPLSTLSNRWAGKGDISKGHSLQMRIIYLPTYLRIFDMRLSENNALSTHTTPSSTLAAASQRIDARIFDACCLKILGLEQRCLSTASGSNERLG